MRIIELQTSRITVRLKRIGLSERLHGPLSSVCYCHRFSLLGRPWRPESFWLLFNQNSSILVSFQAPSKSEKWTNYRWCSLGVYDQVRERWFCRLNAVVSSCLPIVFTLIGAGAAWCWEVTWETQAKAKEIPLQLAFIVLKSGSNQSHPQTPLLSPSFIRYISEYFPYNNNNNKKSPSLLDTIWQAGFRSKVSFHQLLSKPSEGLYLYFIPFRWGNSGLENSINLTVITQLVHFGAETQTPIWIKACPWIWGWVEVVFATGKKDERREKSRVEQNSRVSL